MKIIKHGIYHRNNIDITCPECGCDNHLSERNYKILTTDIKDK